MAVNTIVTRSADLTTEATTGDVVEFIIRGKFDATGAGVDKLRASLRKLGIGDLVTIVEAGTVEAAGKTTKGSDGEAALIRAWAVKNGHDVSDRGRLSADLRAAYYAAQDKTTTTTPDAPATAVESQDEDREPTAAELAAIAAE